MRRAHRPVACLVAVALPRRRRLWDRRVRHDRDVPTVERRAGGDASTPAVAQTRGAIVAALAPFRLQLDDADAAVPAAESRLDSRRARGPSTRSSCRRTPTAATSSSTSSAMRRARRRRRQRARRLHRNRRRARPVPARRPALDPPARHDADLLQLVAGDVARPRLEDDRRGASRRSAWGSRRRADATDHARLRVGGRRSATFRCVSRYSTCRRKGWPAGSARVIEVVGADRGSCRGAPSRRAMRTFARDGERHDLVEAPRFEAEPERRPCRLGRVAVAPRLWRESPADFDGGRETGLEHRGVRGPVNPRKAPSSRRSTAQTALSRPSAQRR